jgi:hypothetical protein
MANENVPSEIIDVLKFEYMSQLLIDSGCLLLMLKIMGMYDLTALAGKRTDITQYW